MSYRTLNRYATTELGSGRRQATVPVADCQPGGEVQVDFGRLGLLTDSGDGRRWVVHGLIFTAVYSRHMFVWPTCRQTLNEVRPHQCVGSGRPPRYRAPADRRRPAAGHAQAKSPAQHRCEQTRHEPRSRADRDPCAPPAPPPHPRPCAPSARTPLHEPTRLSAPNRAPKRPNPQVRPSPIQNSADDV